MLHHIELCGNELVREFVLSLTYEYGTHALFLYSYLLGDPVSDGQRTDSRLRIDCSGLDLRLGHPYDFVLEVEQANLPRLIAFDKDLDLNANAHSRSAFSCTRRSRSLSAA